MEILVSIRATECRLSVSEKFDKNSLSLPVLLRTHKEHGRKYCCLYVGKKFYDGMIPLQSKRRYCAFKELLTIFNIKIVFVEVSA